jgi:hypothetical protein
MVSKEIEQPYGPGWLKLQDDSGQVVIEDARIVFRNFAGKEGQFNREGDRNFCVIIPEDIAEMMKDDGWNVKQLKSREEGVPGDYYVQVSVGFKGRPPNLFLISSKGRVQIGQYECDLLDWVDILKADLIIRPYNWSVNGNTGVKAYLKTLAVTMNEDYLELKYADVPEALPAAASDIREPIGELESGQTPHDEYAGMDIVDADIVED